MNTEEKQQRQIQDLRQRYLEKIKSVEKSSPKNPGDNDIIIGTSRDIKQTDDGDYSSLLSQLYGGDADSWSASSSDPSVSFSTSSGVVYDASVNSGVTASQLDAKLEGGLAGMGKEFIKAGEKYGVDPAMIAAIAIHETGNGDVTTHNNVGGLMDGSEKRHYDSIPDSIDYMGKLLRNSYINQGLTSVEEIQKKYCPVGAANDPNGLNKYWLSGVTKYLNMFGAIKTSSPTSRGGIGRYADSASVGAKILDNIEINPQFYLKSGKIPIPTCKRADYFYTMRKIIEDGGAINQNSLFSSFMQGNRKDKFIDATDKVSSNPHSTFVRTDLAYYLEELHAKTVRDLKVTKLTITSAYRTPEFNNSLSGSSSTSMHMAGCAVDIAVGQKHSDAVIVANAAYSMGFGGIYIGKIKGFFVHLDIGPTMRYQHNSGIGKYINPNQTGL